MKKSLSLLVLALLAVPAFAGSHVEIVSYSIPASEGPVKTPGIVSAKLGKVVVAEHEWGNCDNPESWAMDCHHTADYAQKVRVTVGYVSQAGADPRPEATGDAENEGPMYVNFDFDPAQFDAATLEQLKAKKGAPALFQLTSQVTQQPIQVVDYDKSDFCSPEASASCDDHVVYKTVLAPITTLTVGLK
jgi:hypothetical protein